MSEGNFEDRLHSPCGYPGSKGTHGGKVVRRSQWIYSQSCLRVCPCPSEPCLRMFPWSPDTPAPGSVGAAEEEGRSKLRVAVRLAQPHDRLPPASNPVSDRIRSRISLYQIPYQTVSDRVRCRIRSMSDSNGPHGGVPTFQQKSACLPQSKRGTPVPHAGTLPTTRGRWGYG